jgi:AcrR family transcriptional regulator
LFNLCIMNPTLEHIDKREAILSVAERLFSEQDFDAVSVRDLAKEANVNIAMISYYFGSKEKLFETLIVSKLEESQGNIKDIVSRDKPVIERMYDIIDFYVDKFAGNMAIQKIINREMSLDCRPQVRELIIEKIKMNKQYTKAMFHDEMAKGNIYADADLEMTMMSFFATMYQITGAPHFSCQILEKTRIEELRTPEFRDRIRKYFKSTIKNLLTTNQ